MRDPVERIDNAARYAAMCASDLHPPFRPGRIEVTAAVAPPWLTLARAAQPLPIVLITDDTTIGSPGHPPTPVTLPHGLALGNAAELSTALALAVAHYDVPLARTIANRIDAVLEAETEGRRIPPGMGLTRGWFEPPTGRSGTTRRKP